MENQIKQKSLTIAYLDFDDIKNPLLGGGQARATIEVGKRLAEKGHTVISVCSRYPGYKDRQENGINYHHVGLGSANIQLNNVAYILSLPYVVPQIKADIIIECFTGPISTLFSPLYTRIPVVALPSLFAAREFSKKYYLPFHWIERVGLNFYSYFLPYTEIIDQRMKQVNPRVVSRIVPHGAAQEYFEVEQKDPRYILFLGRLDIAQKGIDLLLKAYKEVSNSIEYPLIVAGHGPDEKKVRDLIRELGLEDKVKMMGPTYGKKKIEILSHALFVAFPSRHDDLPLFSLEALASKLPLVTFDIPEFSWTDKKVAFKAKPFNISDYAKTLKEAATSPKLASMKTNSRNLAKHYSWDKVADQFEEFFLQINERRLYETN
jgi:glycogen synthase